MRILLTGANGYIGKRLLPILLEQGHTVFCCVRNKQRFTHKELLHPNLHLIEVDLLQAKTLEKIPKDIEVSYYLIHSMLHGTEDFDQLEKQCAQNFIDYLKKTENRQIIYLSGIANEDKLSKHLQSRKEVEEILKQSRSYYTILRAGIIVGSGSASFEIIRDLVEKLPIMITPQWLLTKCQPIAIRTVIEYLHKVIFHKDCLNQTFDIGGTEVLSYKQMLQQYAEVRKLKRKIITLPIMTPRLSSYWLFFITSTSYNLAVNLVNSMKVEVICRPNNFAQILNIQPISYKEAIERAMGKIKQQMVISSWKDALSSGRLSNRNFKYVEPPSFGCFFDTKVLPVENQQLALDNIWAVGGDRGWYYANWLWKFRGFIDKLFGGVGLNRGRRHPNEIEIGDSLDFWRVLLADKENKRLLLYAEMKLPGEAWLEFSLNKNQLEQKAIFRPKGLAGRLYWYLSYPFHVFIFRGMIQGIIHYNK
ncbi:SDR family oxidoreductase [Marinifilum caeruleilacunae]|uniref:SDR family oxidoreductase n=1 Tax=Marinifilum caeruleilacunae TaxID=2499076 RepID=A0ABX1WRC5_9BACT|nr:SDR family oxidoreductase [Marinifilum caeruleilacunae]NOU58635.1 SDR family oxidoreductase [Marinifilum caeruleilacunae]